MGSERVPIASSPKRRCPQRSGSTTQAQAAQVAKIHAAEREMSAHSERREGGMPRPSSRTVQ